LTKYPGIDRLAVFNGSETYVEESTPEVTWVFVDI